jgi:hypothetical protein
MKTRILLITLVVGASSLHADTPIQLSLVPDIALFPRTTAVHGLSLSIWGENPQTALAIGLVNGSTGDSGGLSIGIVNYAESYTGVQWGAINVSTENFIGWQHGYVNIAQGTFKGFELGFVNVAEDTTGFQLGAFNYAQRLNGLQIGFINIAMSNPPFDEFPDKLAPGFPILNWSF